MSSVRVAAAFLQIALCALPASSKPAERAGEPALDPQCPMGMPGFVRREGDVCFGEAGPNWTFAFVYPAEAARIASLDALLRRHKVETEREVRNLAAYARGHPAERFLSETGYVADADLPELLALSFTISEYTGGAHGWHRNGTLLWDRRMSRELEPNGLFTAEEAAFGEMESLLCPVLQAARKRKAGERGGRFDGPCPKPPYAFALLTGSSGRIETVRIIFDELDGYAGGQYELYIPVTPGLAALLRERFRPAFRISAATPRACNPNLADKCVRGSPRAQPQ